MNLFRALSTSNELSERALLATTSAITMNASHYSAWVYRRAIVTAIKPILEDELRFTTELLNDNPKSYQIWCFCFFNYNARHHRQWVVSQLGVIPDELTTLDCLSQEESKNYHCWTYRQWYVSLHTLWAKDLFTMDTYIREDVRNNSAWNHRAFCVRSLACALVTRAEIDYTLDKIALALQNESPWLYLGRFDFQHYFTEVFLNY